MNELVSKAKTDFLDRWIDRQPHLTEEKIREGEADTEVQEAIIEAAHWNDVDIETESRLEELAAKLKNRY